MKKLTVILMALCLAGAFGMPAFATDLEFSGEYRVRGHHYVGENFDDDDVSNSYFDMRLRMQPEWKITDNLKLTVRFDALDDKRWGDTDNYANDIDIDRVYMTITTGFGEFRVGRMAHNFFGTEFLDSTFDADKIQFVTQPLGREVPWYVGAAYVKKLERDGGYNYMEGDHTDRDVDLYYLLTVYKGEMIEAGLLYGFLDFGTFYNHATLGQNAYLNNVRAQYSQEDLWTDSSQMRFTYENTLNENERLAYENTYNRMNRYDLPGSQLNVTSLERGVDGTQRWSDLDGSGRGNQVYWTTSNLMVDSWLANELRPIVRERIVDGTQNTYDTLVGLAGNAATLQAMWNNGSLVGIPALTAILAPRGYTAAQIAGLNAMITARDLKDAPAGVGAAYDPVNNLNYLDATAAQLANPNFTYEDLSARDQAYISEQLVKDNAFLYALTRALDGNSGNNYSFRNDWLFGITSEAVDEVLLTTINNLLETERITRQDSSFSIDDYLNELFATSSYDAKAYAHLLNPYFKGKFGPFRAQAELAYGWGKVSSENDAIRDQDVDVFCANVELGLTLGMFDMMAGYAFFDGDADADDDTFEAAGVITYGDDWERPFILTAGSHDLDKIGQYTVTPTAQFGTATINMPTATMELGNLTGGSATTMWGYSMFYAGVDVKPIDSLKIGIMYAYSRADEVPDDYFTADGTRMQWKSKTHGHEWDLRLNWQIYDNLSYWFTAAYLNGGDFWKGYGDGPDDYDSDMYALVHGLTLTF
jgi:hypothetical protein